MRAATTPIPPPSAMADIRKKKNQVISESGLGLGLLPPELLFLVGRGFPGHASAGRRPTTGRCFLLESRGRHPVLLLLVPFAHLQKLNQVHPVAVPFVHAHLMLVTHDDGVEVAHVDANAAQNATVQVDLKSVDNLAPLALPLCLQGVVPSWWRSCTGWGTGECRPYRRCSRALPPRSPQVSAGNPMYRSWSFRGLLGYWSVTGFLNAETMVNTIPFMLANISDPPGLPFRRASPTAAPAG